jgi:hypothetical protein
MVGPQIVRITGGDGVNPEPFTPFGNVLFEEYVARIELSRDPSPLTIDIPGPKSKKAR